MEVGEREEGGGAIKMKKNLRERWRKIGEREKEGGGIEGGGGKKKKKKKKKKTKKTGRRGIKKKLENVGMEGRERKKVVEFFWMVYQVRE